MRKKGITEALGTAVMSLYKGARTKVKVRTHFSEEFEVNFEHTRDQLYHHWSLPLWLLLLARLINRQDVVLDE